MRYDRALALLDILETNGIREIDIMGGEPMLLAWMPDFIEVAFGKKIAVNISTNGSNTEILPRFKNVDPQRCAIGISLEGSNLRDHNMTTNSSHFGAALRSIKSLVSFGLDPIVKTVLTRNNWHDIQSIVDLLKGLGVKRYGIIHMDLLSGEPLLAKDAVGFTEFETFYQSLRRVNADIDVFKVHASCFNRKLLPDGARCAGGVRKLSVLPDGSIFPCNLFHGLEEFLLGNVFDDDLRSLWNSPKLAPFRQYRGNRCGRNDCSNRALCTGGCPAHGHYHYRDAERMDIRCALPK
jgi:uncharacterized protein